jgi:hypothetical protein
MSRDTGHKRSRECPTPIPRWLGGGTDHAGPESAADHCRNALQIIAAAPEPLPDWTAGVVSRLWRALKALEDRTPEILGDERPGVFWLR